jgi:uncharacterized protein YecE (DUF72 family)
MARPEVRKTEAEQPEETSLASVGTSGFSYRDWKGVLYPEWMPARDWFHYYATRFNAVEINLSFYRPPTVKTLERWKESVPSGFGFVLKASQLITHQLRLADCGEDLERMFSGYTPLGPQLACVLFQLPPALGQDHERLDRFINHAAKSREGEPFSPFLALEFRNASWNTVKTLELLARHGCGMVLHDMRVSGGWQWKQGRLEAGELSLSHAELFSRSLPLIYLRFHGTTGKYAGEYGRRLLEPWAALARSALERKIPVHAYFNNTQAGAAVRDAVRLAEMLRA